jgi:hypothetical protein
MRYYAPLTNITLSDPLSVLTFVAYSHNFERLSALHRATNMCTLFQEYSSSGAMQTGELAPIKELIKSRLNIVHDIEDKFPLDVIAYHRAIIKGDLETVQVSGMSVNTALPMGALPILTALLFGQFEVAQWLYAQGASLSATDARGTNAENIALFTFLNKESSVHNMLDIAALEALQHCPHGSAIEGYDCVMKQLAEVH